MGTLGAAIALNITYCSTYLAQEFYIYFVDWPFFSDFIQPFFNKNSLSCQGVKDFLKLGVPGTIMLCAEWWVFEVLAIFAGMLGNH